MSQPVALSANHAESRGNHEWATAGPLLPKFCAESQLDDGRSADGAFVKGWTKLPLHAWLGGGAGATRATQGRGDGASRGEGIIFIKKESI